MSYKKFRFLLLPGETSKAKELSLSKRQIILFSALALTGLFAIFLISANVLSTILYNQKLDTIEYEKNLIIEEISRLEKKSESLETDISILLQRDDDLRTFADIPKLGDDEKEVGIGGAAFPEIKLGKFFESEEERYNQLSKNISKLQRLISLERQSYDIIKSKLENDKERIRYLPTIRPVKGGRTTDVYAMRNHPVSHVRHFHQGVDISIPRGTPVLAAADGVVEMAQKNAGFGFFVRIDHNAGQFGFKTGYGHLSRYNVKKGQRVVRGDIIAWTGDSGTSTAPHLHYEVIFKNEKVDPMLYYFDPAVLR